MSKNNKIWGVSCVKYGLATVSAKSKEEALKIFERGDDNIDIEWQEDYDLFLDGEIVEIEES